MLPGGGPRSDPSALRAVPGQKYAADPPPPAAPPAPQGYRGFQRQAPRGRGEGLIRGEGPPCQWPHAHKCGCCQPGPTQALSRETKSTSLDNIVKKVPPPPRTPAAQPGYPHSSPNLDPPFFFILMVVAAQRRHPLNPRHPSPPSCRATSLLSPVGGVHVDPLSAPRSGEASTQRRE